MAISDSAIRFKNDSIRKRRAPPDSPVELYTSQLARVSIPADVADPEAKVTIAPLCDPELHGHIFKDAAIDPRRVGRPYRYAYGNCVVGGRPSNVLNGTCRVDLADGSVLTWSDAPNAIPAGPPTFVPRPGADPDIETDGVLLVDCLGGDGRAFFAVLDGATFREIGRVTLPYRHCVSVFNMWVWDAAVALKAQG